MRARPVRHSLTERRRGVEPPRLRAVTARHRIIGLLLVVLSAAALSDSELAAAGAETGTTRVSMSIDGSRLAIHLMTDAEALLARLDRLAGRSRSMLPPNDRLADALRRQHDELLRQAILQFDDSVATLRMDAVRAVVDGEGADGASSPSVQVTMSAVVPQGARTVRWSYGLASAAYPFSVRQGSSVATEIVTGADPSTPVALERPSKSIGLTLWALLVPGLFASLIAWRIREGRSRDRSQGPGRTSST